MLTRSLANAYIIMANSSVLMASRLQILLSRVCRARWNRPAGARVRVTETVSHRDGEHIFAVRWQRTHWF